MAEAGSERQPTDPDIDLHVSRQRTELRRAPWGVLGAISVGGAIGAVARYGIGVTWPVTPTGFPWGTFAINVSGCLLIGVLMVLIVERYPDRPLVRPFFGTGVLGGFTTFSTYVVDIQRLAQGSAAGTALVYLLATVLTAVAAVRLAGVLTRWALRPRPPAGAEAVGAGRPGTGSSR